MPTDSVIQSSTVACRTRNPIRAIVDSLRVEPNPSKDFVSLALGDPTTGGNFKLHQRYFNPLFSCCSPSKTSLGGNSCVDAVAASLASFKANGYPPSTGTPVARQAIAEFYSLPAAPLVAQDVILASGCSDALNLAIGVLANEGDNILLPAPGFSLYETLASSKGIESRFYALRPEAFWEVDLVSLESLIDSKTRAILVNSPSNPCGSVYSKSHLEAILASMFYRCLCF